MKPTHALPLAALLLTAAAQAAPLQVSATTTILADIVKNVGGTRVAVNTIVPPGADAHTFQPTTGVIRALSQSRHLFANGGGLEPWLPRLHAALPAVPVKTMLPASRITPLRLNGSTDPHAWWNPANVAEYARQVQGTLTALDPAGKATYAHNTAAYLAQWAQLDTYAKGQFAALPASRRQIVTNHDSLNYLAARYGLKVVGAVIPGLSTEREPSARELAALIDTVKKSGATTIFTENTVNARLAQTLAQATGARVAPPLYTDALGPAGSAGDTFLKAFRFNVDTIVRALR